MFEPFGKIRVKKIRKFIEEKKPLEKIIVDLGAGKPAVTDGIVCKKRIKIDINPASEPDIIYDFTKGIPLEDNYADICVASEVLEHLYYSKTFISEVRRVLKNNGFFILSVPNICSLKYRISFLIGRIPSHAAKGDMFYKDERFGHIRDYNFFELKRLLSLFNFKIIKYESDGISFNGRTIIPQFIIPKTFGDSVIIMAKNQK